MAAEDIGIDLGTSNVLIYERGKGITCNEPAVVALERESRSIRAIGEEAHKRRQISWRCARCATAWWRILN